LIDFGGPPGWYRVVNSSPMSKTHRYSGAIALVLLTSLAGIVGVQALTAADAPVRQITPAASPDAARIAALEKRVAQLETQLKALETKTKLITSDGMTNFTVNAPGPVSLKGSRLDILVATSLSLKSAGQATLESSGNLTIKSALVSINGGGKPAARVAMGSPTVLIGN